MIIDSLEIGVIIIDMTAKGKEYIVGKTFDFGTVGILTAASLACEYQSGTLHKLIPTLIPNNPLTSIPETFTIPLHFLNLDKYAYSTNLTIMEAGLTLAALACIPLFSGINKLVRKK